MQCGALPSQITSQDILTLLENCLPPLPCNHGSVFLNFMDIGPKCAVIWPRIWALPAWVWCAFSICVQRAWAVSGASLPGVSRAGSINRWSSFWQNYSCLISFGLSDGAGWRQNTSGLNANAVPGAGRRAVYYSSRMCLGVQWSVKTQMQNQSYLPLVLSDLIVSFCFPLSFTALLFDLLFEGRKWGPAGRGHLTCLVQGVHFKLLTHP